VQVAAEPPAPAEPENVVFGLGGVSAEPLPAIFAEQIPLNQAKLKAWQDKTASESGYEVTENFTVFGAEIYKVKDIEPAGEETADTATATVGVMFFSGAEMVTAEGVNLASSECPLYDEAAIFDFLNRTPGSLKTQDGVGIQSDIAWTVDIPSGAVFESVLINGAPVGSAMESFGSGENLKLGSITGIETLMQAKEVFNRGGGKVLTVDGAKYQMLGINGGIGIAFDGSTKFLITVDKMITPMSDTGLDGVEGSVHVDVEGFLKLVNQTYGDKLKESGVQGNFQYLVCEIDTPQWVWDVEEASSVEVKPLTVDSSDGCLQINLRALEMATGLKAFVSGTGDTLNLVTDTEFYKQESGSELGYAVGTEVWTARKDVQEANQTYTVIVTREQGAAAEKAAQEEAIRIQQEAAEKAAAKEAADKAAAAAKAAEEKAAAGSGAGAGAQGGQQGQSGGAQQGGPVVDWGSGSSAVSGSTSGSPLAGQPEPAGGCPQSGVSGARWIQSEGVWEGKGQLGDTIWVYPDGTMSYING
jgi:hypothetical protein